MLTKQPFARRIVIAFTLMTLVVSGVFSLGIVAVVYFVESQLVTGELSRELDIVLHEDLPSGRPPRLDAQTRFFSTALPDYPLPEGFATLPEGFTEVVRGDEAYYVYVRDLDGERYVLLPPAQDHKRVGEGDTGPNTGGMGAYAPAPFLSDAQLSEVGEQVIAPTLATLRRRGIPFRGALYAGLMLTRSGPKVLEFNARFGDPETQVLMMQLAEDVLPLLDACARGTLEQRPLAVHPGASVGVVLAAQGYPETPRRGDRIDGVDAVPASCPVFAAGVEEKGGAWLTAGGRVLTVCARGADLAEARSQAYAATARLRFEGMHFRRDIGAKGLRAPAVK